MSLVFFPPVYLESTLNGKGEDRLCSQASFHWTSYHVPRRHALKFSNCKQNAGFLTASFTVVQTPPVQKAVTATATGFPSLLSPRSFHSTSCILKILQDHLSQGNF
jgi:hypothetical protein